LGCVPLLLSAAVSEFLCEFQARCSRDGAAGFDRGSANSTTVRSVSSGRFNPHGSQCLGRHGKHEGNAFAGAKTPVRSRRTKAHSLDAIWPCLFEGHLSASTRFHQLRREPKVDI